VLIRLPDLSPQALIREPNAAAAAPQEPPHDTSPAAAKPIADAAVVAASENSSPQPEATQPDSVVATANGTPATIQLTVDPVTVAKSTEGEKSNTSSIDTTSKESAPDDSVPVASSVVQTTAAAAMDEQAEGSSQGTTAPTSGSSARRRRTRSRDGQGQDRQQNDKVRPGSQSESRRGTKRRTSRATQEVPTEHNILAFDKTRLSIGAGLVVVAGLTYFALSGGGSEDPAEPADGWAGNETGAVVQTVEPIAEPEMDLWPADHTAQVNHEASSQQPQSAAHSHETSDANPVWPADSTQQQAAQSQDPTGMPAADYSYGAPPMTAPTNARGYADANYDAPRNEAPTDGWPSESPTTIQPASASESSTTIQPASTSESVNGWPDAAMSTPAPTQAPAAAPQGYYYPSQAAGYTSPQTPTGGTNAPVARTGRLSTGPYPGGPATTTNNPGSQLNGTIEIPRPRANNEYNGSNVY